VFGNKSLPARVYAYSAREPRTEAETVRESFILARKYRNALVELEIKRRDDMNQVIRKHFPELLKLDAEIGELEQGIAELHAAIKHQNMKGRERNPDPGIRAQVKDLKARLKELRATHKDTRKTAYAHPSVIDEQESVEERHRAEAKRLRADCGVHWGTYVQVEQGLGGIRSGAPPKFVGKNWPGKLAAQLQGGASWEEVVGTGHGQCSVEVLPLPPHALPNGRRSKRPWCILRLRVASEGRKGVYAEIPFVMHRPLPEDGRIKWVYYTRRQKGTHFEYQVQFVVAREEWSHGDAAKGNSICGVDFGWRRQEDGSMRVAYAVGSDGHTEQLVLPAEKISQWTKGESLQSIRDRNFEPVLEGFRAWLAVRGDDELPQWFADATSTVGQWRAQARLAALAIRWRDQRFEGDEEVFQKVEAWRKQDKHLYDWQAAQLAKAIRWRLDLYRRFAAGLRQRYAVLAIEDTNWREMLKRPDTEDANEPEALNRRWAARLASPGLLRQTLKNGHHQIVEVPSADTTRTCHLCGSDPAGDWDASGEIDYRCELGHQADQDLNAAVNIMRSGEAVWVSEMMAAAN
jgi:hypothetical protein